MTNAFDGFGGDLLETNLTLNDLGASGFILRERLDFSGHYSGRVTPHVNVELINSSERVLSRDLTNNQLPGFNGMQASYE